MDASGMWVHLGIYHLSPDLLCVLIQGWLPAMALTVLGKSHAQWLAVFF